MRLLTRLIEEGMILSTPTHTIGPFQTATGSAEFAVCDMRGPVLTGDLWRVAARFIVLVGRDEIRVSLRRKLGLISKQI